MSVGEWHIHATCSLEQTSGSPGTLHAELFVNDSATAETEEAILNAKLATVGQSWKVTVTTADTPIELKARKGNAGGTAKAKTDDTTLAALAIGDAGFGPASATVVSETAFGQAAAAGSASTHSRGDHTHGTPTDPVTAHAAAADPHTVYGALAQAETWAALQTFDAGVTLGGGALRIHNDGIEDRLGTKHISMSTAFGATALTFLNAVSGNTVIVEDGDLRMDDGDLNVQGNNLRTTNMNVFGSGSTALRVQPRGANAESNLQALPSGTSRIATFDMFRDSAAAAADRVRFGVNDALFGISVGANITAMFMPDAVSLGSGVAPPASTSLELKSTVGALLLNRLTTTQRNALTALNGMVIYNTTDNVVQAYENGSWVDL